MRQTISWALCTLSGVGLVLLFVQWLALRNYLRSPTIKPFSRPPISILKPLCGVDDGLCENLLSFLALDYPEYELLLGVKDEDDAAYPMARLFANRFPKRIRLIVQLGAPGLNPKINQLISLGRAARHELLVVSDSNIRVRPDYLEDIAAQLEDPRVALVTHPISGAGANSRDAGTGSRLDNLHLGSYVAPGVIAARLVIGQDIVIGKSMALRRRDLRAIGGFEGARDVLAEDFYLGGRVRRLAGRRIALGARPVSNFSKSRSLFEFYDRYRRWGVLHRQGIGTLAYLSELLLQPTVLSLAAFLVAPTSLAFAALAVTAALKCALDVASAGALSDEKMPVRAMLWQLVLVHVKDAVLAAAWLHGLLNVHVSWRGTRLRVFPGTWLRRPPASAGEPGPKGMEVFG